MQSHQKGTDSIQWEHGVAGFGGQRGYKAFCLIVDFLRLALALLGGTSARSEGFTPEGQVHTMPL